jgi:hypothetical protein
VAKNPLVDVVIPNTPMSGDSYNAIPRQGATRRADSSTMRPPTFNLVRQVGSQTPLKLISQRAIFKANVLQDYRYDPIAGDDITIYVIDTGFFRGAQVRTHLVRVFLNDSSQSMERTSTLTQTAW